MDAPDEQAVLALVRLRLLLPDGQLEGEVAAFYPGEADDLWVAPVFDAGAGRPAVVYAPGGRPCAQAGLARASSRLRDLDVLAGERRPWAARRLRPLLDAVGGLTPGLNPFADEAPVEGPDGGIGRSFGAPADWIEFAAGGARGVPPEAGSVADPRGVTPPLPQGTSTVTVDADHRIVWRHEVAGAEVGRFEGHWSQDRAAADEPDALVAEGLVASVRRHLPSPLAVAARPPARVRVQGRTTTWSVELLGHDPVEITEAGGVPRPPGG